MVTLNIEKPEVTVRKALHIQVCVPDDWSDEEVISFANTEAICGTENGWFIRREGDKALDGSPERVECEKKPGYIHIILDA